MKNPITVLAIVVLFFLVPVLTGQSQVQEKTDATQEQLKLDIVLVIDNSGSMRKNDPKFLTRNVVTNFLTGFEKRSRFGIVIFDQEAEVVEPLIAITDLEAEDKFLKSLDKVTYSGQFSNTPAAIERAIYELKINGRAEAQKVEAYSSEQDREVHRCVTEGWSDHGACLG